MQEQHGRVGIDCSHLATAGGIQTYLSNLLPALFHEAPHVAFVLYSRGRRKAKVAPDIASRASARVHAWAPSRWLAYAERKWSWPPVEWWTGPLAVFHATHFALPRLRGARSVLSVMDATYWRHPEFYSNRQLNEFGYRRLLPDAVARADRILAISESTKRDVVEFLGVAADKVWVVPLARDPAFNPAAEADRSATRRRYGLTRRFLIYPAGTLEPRKNLVRALDAFRAAFADPARRPMLVVTGVGALPADAGAAIDRWGLRADVRLISAKGPAELRSLLCCAEFGIYPSLYEGFGLPALEMLACGLPVVTSSTSALPEVVGDAAVLVDPYNVDELRGALGRMNEDLELRAELRRRALARAHSWQFSWQRVARQTLEAYFSSAPARPLAAAVVAAAAAAVASR